MGNTQIMHRAFTSGCSPATDIILRSNMQVLLSLMLSMICFSCILFYILHAYGYHPWPITRLTCIYTCMWHSKILWTWTHTNQLSSVSHSPQQFSEFGSLKIKINNSDMFPSLYLLLKQEAVQCHNFAWDVQRRKCAYLNCAVIILSVITEFN